MSPPKLLWGGGPAQPEICPGLGPGAWSQGTEPSAIEVCVGEMGRPEQRGQSRCTLSKVEQNIQVTKRYYLKKNLYYVTIICVYFSVFFLPFFRANLFKSRQVDHVCVPYSDPSASDLSFSRFYQHQISPFPRRLCRMSLNDHT